MALHSALAVGAQSGHQQWDELLKRHVVSSDGGRVTRVDYAGVQQDQGLLQSYLGELASVPRQQFEAWPLENQLAFLINAYNAWTVQLIIGEYPDIDSIRDIGFLPGTAWRRDIVSLFGEQWSLDEVEHDMIRGWSRYQEPRIHFAVNCAAIGCPALRGEAFVGDRLEQQLEDSTRLFLSDRDRNYLTDDTAYVSRIFDWYEEDFEKGWLGVNSVEEFLLRYRQALDMDAEAVTLLQQGRMRIRYLDYDWGLNDTTD